MWKFIMPLRDQPVAIILSRQALPTLDRQTFASAEGVHKVLPNAYTLQLGMCLKPSETTILRCCLQLDSADSDGLGSVFKR